MKHSFREWVVATRPWSFPASVMPVAVAAVWVAVTGQSVNWWLAVAAMVNIVLVHAAGNVWSDYYDFKCGVDRDGAYCVSTLTSGKFSLREVWTLSVGLQTVAVVMGCTIVALTGLPLLWIGLSGIGLSLLYPPLKYHALGDVVIGLCYAVLPMLGTTFIVSGEVMPEVLWLALPVGAITVGILHANNTRDIEMDAAAGIKTFTILTGRRTAVQLYALEVLLPYVWLVGICGLGLVDWCALLAFLSLPLALRNVRVMTSDCEADKDAFLRLDEATAQLQLAFSMLLIVGLLLSLLLR